MLPKNTPKTLNLRQMNQEKNNNQIKDELGNISKPLLSSRLIRFRIWIESSSFMMENIDIQNIFYYKDQVLKNIVMQYTGVRDKNGIEICEGDVLYFEDDCTSEKVYFENGCFGVMGRYNFISLMETNINIAKIITNIYVNPELL